MKPNPDEELTKASLVLTMPTRMFEALDEEAGEHLMSIDELVSCLVVGFWLSEHGLYENVDWKGLREHFGIGPGEPVTLFE